MGAILLVFAVVVTAALALTGGLKVAPAGVEGRVAELAGPGTPRTRNKAILRRLATVIEPIIRGRELTRSLDRQLYQVGWAWSAGEFLIACFLLGVAGALVPLAITGKALIALAAGMVAATLPVIQLRRKRAAANKALSDQLPDSLMLIINGIRAGHAFLAALQIVSRQMSGPIAREFATTVAEINWGLPVETALNNLSDRVGTVDMELIVAAMLVQRESGGNLGEILMNLHDTLRDRVRIQGEVQALTASGRLSGIVLTSLPVVVGALFYLVSPAYISGLFNDPRGHLLLGGALGAQLLGIFFIRRIVDVRY